MQEHVATKRAYFGVFAALMLLLIATVAAARVDLGPFNDVVWVVIAVVKAALVLLFFMHLRPASKITWLFARGGRPLVYDYAATGGTLADCI